MDLLNSSKINALFYFDLNSILNDFTIVKYFAIY